MKYEIQNAVDYIVDTSKPSDLRAIELFILVVALHLGQSIAAVTGHKRRSPTENSLVLSVSRSHLRTARLLAGMKFLERIEAEWKEANPGVRATVQRMAENREFARIYNRIILKHGSWYKIRYTSGLRQFEALIKDRRRYARQVAHLIEFSARFDANHKKPRQIGGITMAIDIASGEAGRSYFRTKIGKSQMEAAWSELKSAAPFLYLIYKQKHEFGLGKLAGKNFRKRWRDKADNIKALHEFLGSYRALIEHLKTRGYTYSALALPSEYPENTPLFGSFRKDDPRVKDILDEIERYTKG